MKRVATIITAGAAAAASIAGLATSAGAATSHQKAQFIKAVHDGAPSTDRFANQRVIALGQDVCSVFRDGGTVLSVLDEWHKSSAVTQNAYITIVGKAVVYLCADQRTQVAAQIRQDQGD